MVARAGPGADAWNHAAMAAETPTRVIRLRYGAKCVVCFRVLEPGTKAEWNSRRKVAICLPCVSGRASSPVSQPSEAGRSARAEGVRRRSRQQARLAAEREARPLLGRLRQAMSPERDAGAAWDKGGEGEARLAESLNEIVDEGSIHALHDRRIPGSRANIDHLLVAATGIWVVDAKWYQGLIKREYRGSVFSGHNVLSVRGRDRSSLIQGVHKQVEAVGRSLQDEIISEAPPVRGVLCFVDGDWGWRMRPFSIDEVIVTWPKALRAALRAEGSIQSDARSHLADALGSWFPPAI
jgi:Nuclease-related domain